MKKKLVSFKARRSNNENNKKLQNKSLNVFEIEQKK